MIDVDRSTGALIAVSGVAAVAVYLLPTFVALRRDTVARTEVILLNLCLGWTGVAWACALVLAFGTRRPRPAATPPPTRPVPRPLPSDRAVYRDGVYLVSAGADTHTWAIRETGRWSIVYELGGEERLAATVSEADVPLSVLAAALETTADSR